MQPFYSVIKQLSLVGFFALTFMSSRVSATNYPSVDDQKIEKLYHDLNRNPQSIMTERLEKAALFFIGKPYLLGALGEGSEGHFDQSPLYRTDGFDCETYVDTVLALALAANSSVFKQCMNKIRYTDGRVGFLTRNHFISLDWNPGNQRQAFIKDITASIKNEQHQSVSQLARALIDKPAWYQHMTTERITLHPDNPELQQKRLLELKKRGATLAISEASIPYLPLTALFDKQGKANTYLFAQIPHGAIIEIVRPNWDLSLQIGTHLNVSHLGFAFRNHGELFFRQASSTYGKVMDVPLIAYLSKARQSPTIRGINVQIVLPEKPLVNGCVAVNT